MAYSQRAYLSQLVAESINGGLSSGGEVTKMSGSAVNSSSEDGPQTDHPENIVLARYRMPSHLPDDFYGNLVHRILPFCGNEYETSDFHSAIQALNLELYLKLDITEEKVLALLLTGLAQAYRFGGDVHIESRLGENSAVHSCHTAILMTEMFRRAGLFEQDQQTAEIIGMRVETTLSCLVHDMGEILGEFTSLGQRATDASLKEDPLLERKVFETALRLAYKAVHDGRHDRFYHAIQGMREQVEELRHDGGDFSGIDSILAPHEVREMPEELEGSIQMFLSLFDMAELKESDVSLGERKLFRGYAVKSGRASSGNPPSYTIC